MVESCRPASAVRRKRAKDETRDGVQHFSCEAGFAETAAGCAVYGVILHASFALSALARMFQETLLCAQ